GRTRGARAALPPDAVHLPAASRPHQHRCLPEGQRSAHRRGHRIVAGHAEIPDATHRTAREPRRGRERAAPVIYPDGQGHMKRSERLDVVQQAAARTERERAERVGVAERHLAEMEQKLQALEKYRGEYEAGFATRAGGGVDVIGMRDFQTFLARLGEALVQQRELVALARKALDAERSNWREAAQ